MKKNIRIAAMATLSVAALTLGACASNGEGGSSSGKAKVEVNLAGDYNELDRDQIKDGGELVLPIEEISEQMNDSHGNSTRYARDLNYWIHPKLTLLNGKGDWEPNPDYLTSVKDEVVDGKLVVTYDIHEKATFNDGTPIDWKAFEHTWKMTNGSNPDLQVSSTDGYDLIESVERGESDKQAVVKFNGTYPWWQQVFSGLLHPAVNTPEIFNEGFINNPHDEWGGGPFKVEKWDPNGGTVTFVPNEKWWGDKPKLDKVTFRQMEDKAMINAFKAGEIDSTRVANKDNLAVAQSMGDAIDIRGALQNSNSLLTLNAQAPQLKDVKVREAVFAGIDRAQVAAIRFNGLDYTEKLPGSFFLYQTQEGYEDNFGSVVSYDPEKAKKLLDEAGWVEGADGIREKDGEKLSLRYIVIGDNQIIKSMASAVQKMLKDVGIDVKIEERPSSDFSKVITKKDFDIFPMGFSSSSPWGTAFFGQTYKSDSELNRSGTGSPELDAKIDALQKLPTAEEQIAEANKLEKEAFEQYGIMPMYNGPNLVGTKKGLANYGAYGFASVAMEDIGWAKDAS
ncbi:MAG: ABC transporter family substrate-binding protein [Corynebacterium sp.]|uniref:ABC transporter family substrate-binding protein n=1 Tax=Corynebacterium sp. TaxID=1720 RepID=UPI0026DC987B|nr:ABC transporter family substrate-binding protein [Corynebacterium sp.]MDO5098148.1 ABC transporter family substrate-binding protein [Corynebacterium sp.]